MQKLSSRMGLTSSSQSTQAARRAALPLTAFKRLARAQALAAQPGAAV